MRVNRGWLLFLWMSSAPNAEKKKLHRSKTLFDHENEPPLLDACCLVAHSALSPRDHTKRPHSALSPRDETLARATKALRTRVQRSVLREFIGLNLFVMISLNLKYVDHAI